MRTLVLDQSYRPINAVTWQRAIGYVVRDRADVLEEYGEVVHAGMQMPAVVRLRDVQRRDKQKVKFSRINVLSRDHWKCCYCGHRFPTSELTYDHVIPRAQGGKTVWENIVSSCYSCNQAKANRTPAQADMRLLSKPIRPTWLPSFNPRLRMPLKDVPVLWRNYWTVELEQG